MNIGRQVEQLRAFGDTSGRSSGGGGVADTVGRLFGNGLGLSPLLSGLAGLFGGGDDTSSPPPLASYVKPTAIHLDAGFSDAAGGGAFAVDRSQGGSPRSMASPAPAQITIQVQAMDSRSFLDHSQDIAMAVRQAMLETTVLNDVIREV